MKGIFIPFAIYGFLAWWDLLVEYWPLDKQLSASYWITVFFNGNYGLLVDPNVVWIQFGLLMIVATTIILLINNKEKNE